MPWAVLFHPEFEPEFGELPEIVQDELLTRLGVLQVRPLLGSSECGYAARIKLSEYEGAPVQA
jgi:hypothetical protein